MAKLSYIAVGRRKEAVARIKMGSGSGKIIVNGKPFDQYFPLKSLQVRVVEPLKVTNMEGRVNVEAKVEGGGLSGQAGALRHGIARALVVLDPSLKVTLKKFKMLTRDPRMKERRKYGLKKARKAPQFSKR
ncbi:MAG: 30S ribosomal protein S9 [Bacillota bacterium]